MNDKKFAFITCVNSDYWYDECTLYLKSLNVPKNFSVEIIPVRGAKSMTAGYNSAMKNSDAKYKIYLHQDTFVVNKNLMQDLLNIFTDKEIGAVGVIGCMNLPASGVWWDGLRTYGRVLHACEPESVVDSECDEPDGDYQTVESVDGLFLFWLRSMIYFGAKIYLTAGTCMTLPFVRKCNAPVTKLLCRIKQKIFGAYTALRKSRLTRATENTKKYSCASTAMN